MPRALTKLCVPRRGSCAAAERHVPLASLTHRQSRMRYAAQDPSCHLPPPTSFRRNKQSETHRRGRDPQGRGQGVKSRHSQAPARGTTRNGKGSTYRERSIAGACGDQLCSVLNAKGFRPRPPLPLLRQIKEPNGLTTQALSSHEEAKRGPCLPRRLYARIYASYRATSVWAREHLGLAASG